MMRYAAMTKLLLLGGLCFSTVLLADELSFRGALIEPPACSINNGEDIDVDFGERVGIKKVNGVNYLQPVSYRITCEPNASKWNMTLTVIGIQTAYDKAAVRTDVTDLGIRLIQNGKPFELNLPIPVNPANPPTLEAVPVQRPGAILEEGVFLATATLQAVYQ
ncbi:fimbrial protein [Serratia proteamaculans]|uniref:fimbrial protein n=1 Tax=Serratia proteamaculans TaxID=28151 RepID=UPI00217A433A|nr:fimbrial protein [Serratia proteamaculans]CAI0854438.1 Minor fimbrial protein prsF precursor [Serratia proteamaculans]CAI1212616.1 Minor fimbrial protein prsF precursor [Serratia proteamaculans]CAI1611510.1 Minor fimbrial protein prsF precursor [Serratia proteamaculans]